jgi:hypothetical protein
LYIKYDANSFIKARMTNDFEEEFLEELETYYNAPPLEIRAIPEKFAYYSYGIAAGSSLVVGISILFLMAVRHWENGLLAIALLFIGIGICAFYFWSDDFKTIVVKRDTIEIQPIWGTKKVYHRTAIQYFTESQTSGYKGGISYSICTITFENNIKLAFNRENVKNYHALKAAITKGEKRVKNPEAPFV